jgi:urea transporter
MSSSFNVYLIGYIILVIGLALGAYLAGAPPIWIAVGVICLVGIGILSAVKKTQGRSLNAPRTGGPQPPARY